MAEQIYSKEFFGTRNIFYDHKDKARQEALVEANAFLIQYDSIDIINIVEYWNEAESRIHLIVYYKNYI